MADDTNRIETPTDTCAECGDPFCTGVACDTCATRMCGQFAQSWGKPWCVNCDTFLYTFGRHYVVGVDCARCGWPLEKPIDSNLSTDDDDDDPDRQHFHSLCWRLYTGEDCESLEPPDRSIRDRAVRDAIYAKNTKWNRPTV